MNTAYQYIPIANAPVSEVNLILIGIVTEEKILMRTFECYSLKKHLNEVIRSPEGAFKVRLVSTGSPACLDLRGNLLKVVLGR